MARTLVGLGSGCIYATPRHARESRPRGAASCGCGTGHGMRIRISIFFEPSRGRETTNVKHKLAPSVAGRARAPLMVRFDSSSFVHTTPQYKFNNHIHHFDLRILATRGRIGCVVAPRPGAPARTPTISVSAPRLSSRRSPQRREHGSPHSAQRSARAPLSPSGHCVVRRHAHIMPRTHYVLALSSLGRRSLSRLSTCHQR